MDDYEGCGAGIAIDSRSCPACDLPVGPVDVEPAALDIREKLDKRSKCSMARTP